MRFTCCLLNAIRPWWETQTVTNPFHKLHNWTFFYQMILIFFIISKKSLIFFLTCYLTQTGIQALKKTQITGKFIAIGSTIKNIIYTMLISYNQNLLNIMYPGSLTIDLDLWFNLFIDRMKIYKKISIISYMYDLRLYMNLFFMIPLFLIY